MTIDDMKKAKAEAEKQIGEILTKFENDFRVPVYRVEIEDAGKDMAFLFAHHPELRQATWGKKASIEVRL